MRAVNLIPADQRRASGAAGKSGGGVYLMLVGLALVVAMVGALTLTNRSITDKETTASGLEQRADAASAKAGTLAAYKQFNQVVVERTAAVTVLAGSRFDWGETLEQVSRVLPSDVSLTQLVASAAPGLGGGTVGVRSSMQNPAIEIVGCAPSQARVALLMARLRRLEGVERVSVASSNKQDEASAPQSGSSGGGVNSCQTTDEIPQFQMVVFFGTPQAAGLESAPSGLQGAIKTLNEGASGATTTPAPATPGS